MDPLGLAPNIVLNISKERENDFEIREIGYVTPYQITQFTKYSDLGIFKRVKDYADMDIWGLAEISSMKLIVESFDRFTAGGTSRNDAKIKHIVDLADIYVEPILRDKLSVGISTVSETLEYIDLTKSAGFGCGSTKEAFVRQHLTEANEYLNNRELLLDYIPVWTVTAKDEVRMRGKLPRTIQAPPVLYQLAHQLYFKKQTLSLFSDPDNSVFRPGIELPGNWHSIVKDLIMHKDKQFETVYFEWDGKTFDASQPRPIRMFSGHIRVKNLICSDADRAIAAHLYRHEGWRINLLPNGKLVETGQGLASGSPNTTPDNCISHLVMIFGCWVESGREPSRFHKFTIRSGLSIFGDDGIAAGHSDDDVSFFRQLPDLWFDLYGVPCILHESTKLSEVTFLGFRSSSETDLGKLVAVPADPVKLASSLLLKGRNVDPLTVLQQGVAHRHLYSLYRFNTPDCEGLCDALDADLLEYVNSLEPNYGGSPQFEKLKFFSTCPWISLVTNLNTDSVLELLSEHMD